MTRSACSRFFRAAALPGVLALLLFVSLPPARADIVQTKDGRFLEGQIVSETPEEVRIKVKLGTITIKRDNVLKITHKEVDQFDDILKELQAALDEYHKGKPFTAQTRLKALRERYPKSSFYKDAKKQEEAFAHLALEGLSIGGKPIASLEDLLFAFELYTKNLCPDCEGAGQIKCATCKGKGGAPCPECEGQGSKKCELCHGAGKTECPQCRGKMLVGYPPKNCLRCPDSRGSPCGKIQCPQCVGRGAHPCSGGCKDGVLEGQCPDCLGKKLKKCSSCAGTGKRPGADPAPTK